MIGVISKSRQHPIVEEFFQLFKVPWEFYKHGQNYDIVIATDDTIALPSGKLVVIFSPETTTFDKNRTNTYLHTGGVILEHKNLQFPVYTNLATFQSENSFMKTKDRKESVGFVSLQQNQKILRIGYDLFDEIEFLLSRGQPVEYAQIPTVEIHISMLRDWILQSNISFVEIPPVPNGYSGIACLTHDVDFIDIRSHKFDRSVIGFALRALFPRFNGNSRSDITWPKILKNWKALLSLPGVYLGLFRDFWFDIDRYSGIEKGMGSTFFFIPFKNNSGDVTKNNPPRYRAARYDINKYKNVIKDLIKNGHEIGLHGIDAWHDHEKGQKELDVIRQITSDKETGVRMHWLYFHEDSPKTLEKTGFFYDSTLGYNNAVGFRAGTTQVFCLPGTSNMLELPLTVMDTALFYRSRMGVSEAEALMMCKKLMNDIRTYGGVFTTNWHTRSLSPERNWDDFYIELLRILKAENVWFATAKQAVNWFKMRRSIRFDDINFSKNKMHIKLSSDNNSGLPSLVFRLHTPQNNSLRSEHSNSIKLFIDIPWAGKPEIEATLQ